MDLELQLRRGQKLDAKPPAANGKQKFKLKRKLRKETPSSEKASESQQDYLVCAYVRACVCACVLCVLCACVYACACACVCVHVRVSDSGHL